MGIIRKTKSVSIILDIFAKKKGAISVVHLINQLESTMNKTTIYRILERLDQDGIVHSFLGKDGEKWYAKCHNCSTEHHQDKHPHFQCKDCGKVDCIPVSVDIPAVPKRTIEYSHILLVGQCESCSL